MRQDYLCPESRLSEILSTLESSAKLGLGKLEALLLEFPKDARLPFLKGSVLASQGDISGACASMRRAVDMAPDFFIAKFQLGFLLLTSGEVAAAQEIWEPLHDLPNDSYLNLFAKGLSFLVRDEFMEARRLLELGIAKNHDNSPLNRDMQLIIDNIQDGSANSQAVSPVSSVDLLLRQAALKPKH